LPRGGRGSHRRKLLEKQGKTVKKGGSGRRGKGPHQRTGRPPREDRRPDYVIAHESGHQRTARPVVQAGKTERKAETARPPAGEIRSRVWHNLFERSRDCASFPAAARIEKAVNFALGKKYLTAEEASNIMQPVSEYRAQQVRELSELLFKGEPISDYREARNRAVRTYGTDALGLEASVWISISLLEKEMAGQKQRLDSLPVLRRMISITEADLKAEAINKAVRDRIVGVLNHRINWRSAKARAIVAEPKPEAGARPARTEISPGRQAASMRAERDIIDLVRREESAAARVVRPDEVRRSAPLPKRRYETPAVFSEPIADKKIGLNRQARLIAERSGVEPWEAQMQVYRTHLGGSGFELLFDAYHKIGKKRVNERGVYPDHGSQRYHWEVFHRNMAVATKNYSPRDIHQFGKTMVRAVEAGAIVDFVPREDHFFVRMRIPGEWKLARMEGPEISFAVEEFRNGMVVKIADARKWSMEQEYKLKGYDESYYGKFFLNEAMDQQIMDLLNGFAI